MKNVWLQRSQDKYYRSETKRCFRDFSYFATNYLKVKMPPKSGGRVELLPMHPYIERLIDHYQSHRFSIVTKFRQGALTTWTMAYMLWNCLLKLDKSAMMLSKTDKEAIALGEMVDRMIDNLPVWLQPEKGKWNDHTKEFKDTGSVMRFHQPQAACGKSMDWLVVDEAAFIPDMQSHWNAMWPVLSTGGNCILISTVGKKLEDENKTKKNWFYKTHRAAFQGKNNFKIFDVHYKEHPDYADPVWCQTLRSRLGEEGWKQEIEMEFLD